MSVPMPAAAARLLPTFDESRLVDELRALRETTWGQQRPYDADVLPSAGIDWRCLSLRSLGGDGARTDPGGPGAESFADTPWLERVPYLGEVLKTVPGSLRAARLMALGMGVRSVDHFDTKCGPAWGVARLHVPITTNPGALLVLDGVKHSWQPGTFWFGDFSRRHMVLNEGPSVRVHLVIDCLVTPELADIFPPDWGPYFQHGDVLYCKPELPPRAGHFTPASWQARLPSAFLDWEEDDIFDDSAERTSAVITVSADGAHLTSECGRSFGLIRIKGDEYRLAGWSDERTVELVTGTPGRVVLRTRCGRSAGGIAVPAYAIPAGSRTRS
ncbi:aspartyl/asparaginyl beta-hydroxylase domain-containing protein [Streptomyces sp. NPDC007164]|uniref:aspartyl/asparaginyl beta-hydroxylase domain-containing protein n=1 Tax=Streptomyces sp. NPDC007164 TaxID=3156918 RepID=UPI0033F4EE71